MDQAFWMGLGVQAINVLVPVVLTALAALITALATLAVQKIKLAAAELKDKQPKVYDFIMTHAQDAVLIAEQLKLNAVIEDKKDWAIKYVQDKADAAGIEVNVEDVANMIEKIVFEEFNRDPIF